MRTVWLILLLTLPLPAAAAEWVRVHTSGEGDQYYYDRSKLFINGDEITYWKKAVFKAPQPVKNQFAASGLFRERIHCAEHTLKLISYLLYAADGSTIEYVAANEGDAAPIIPDTLGDIFEKTTCELVRLKHEEQRRKAPEETQKTEPKKAEPQKQGIAPPLPGPTPGVEPQPVAPPVVQKVEPPPIAPSEDTRPASKEN
ncbi:hypothetical protein SKTS_33490 [Sulfurimicrobium lacus]|uniref:Surface-adhesin protein E-like domain-containing protein n=1 Tax=Sulfurimicrobium lacus TaxID=2715678 RepID=A0A6F8VF63_9PROT|nr:hypothetical protein SKTS_33490 [Sulfurimicrobium lacus]